MIGIDFGWRCKTYPNLFEGYRSSLNLFNSLNKFVQVILDPDTLCVCQKASDLQKGSNKLYINLQYNMNLILLIILIFFRLV